MKNTNYRASLSVIILLISEFFLCNVQAQPNIQWQKCLGGSSIYEQGFCVKQLGTTNKLIVFGRTNGNGGDVTGYHGGFFDIWVVKLGPSQNILWQKCLGGSASDNVGLNMQQTSDQGFIIIGSTNSTDGDVSSNHGGYDIWVIKLNSIGTIEWEKCFGGSENDYGNDIQQTSDGGYIFTGNTNSNDGDVSGNHGASDVWIVKIDDSGNLISQQCFGGTFSESGNSMVLSYKQGTSILSGVTIAGAAFSNDGDVSGNHSPGGFGFPADYWVFKTNGSLTLLWQKCIGGSDMDEAMSIAKTSDGGYIISGITYSSNYDFVTNHSPTYQDVGIAKLSSTGNLTWSKCYGGGSNDAAWNIIQTSDGNFVFVGITYSNDNDVSGNHGDFDIWVVKINPSQNIIWQKCFGGTEEDGIGSGIQQTTDGGYVFVGSTNSNNGDVSGNHGGSDLWVVKLDNTAKMISEDFISKNLGAKMFPTINDGNFTIELFLNEKLPVNISIFDPFGRIVYEMHQSLDLGKNALSIYLNKSLQGSYFVVVAVNGKTEVSRILVQQ